MINDGTINTDQMIISDQNINVVLSLNNSRSERSIANEAG